MHVSASVQAAEAPMPRQEKRKQTEVTTFFAPISGSKKAKVQPIGLQQLPADVKEIILSFLVSAPGNTNEARLQAAAQNIRNFMILNKNFNKYLNDEDTNGHIIIELAKRYTDNDIEHTADALHTRAGMNWVRTIKPKFEQAICNGNLKVVSQILNKFPYLVNTKINIEDYSYDTPLIASVTRGNLEMIKLLLTIPGINANEEDDLGNTPLVSTYLDLDDKNPNKGEIIALLKAHGAKWNNITNQDESDSNEEQ